MEIDTATAQGVKASQKKTHSFNVTNGGNLLSSFQHPSEFCELFLSLNHHLYDRERLQFFHQDA